MGYYSRFPGAMLDKYLISMHNAPMSHAQRAQTSGDVCFV